MEKQRGNVRLIQTYKEQICDAGDSNLKYSTKIKSITALLTITSLLIGYWYGLLVNDLYSDGFSSTSYHASIENDPALVEAYDQINNLKHQLTQLAQKSSHSSRQLQKTRTADSGQHRNTNLSMYQSGNHKEPEQVETGKWTQKTISKITQALVQQGIDNITISELRCNTSLCTAIFSHKNSAEHYQLIQHLNKIKEFSKGFIVKTDDNNNQTKTTVYFPHSSQL